MIRKTLAATLLGGAGLLVALPSQAHSDVRAQLHIGHAPVQLTLGHGHWFRPAPVTRHTHDARCYREHASHDTHWAPHVRRQQQTRPYHRPVKKPTRHAYGHHRHGDDHAHRRPHRHHHDD